MIERYCQHCIERAKYYKSVMNKITDSESMHLAQVEHASDIQIYENLLKSKHIQEHLK